METRREMGILNKLAWVVAVIALLGAGYLGYELRDASADKVALEQSLRVEKNKTKQANYRAQVLTSSIQEIRNSVEGVLMRRETLVKEVQIVQQMPINDQRCGPAVHYAVEQLRTHAANDGAGLLSDVSRTGPNPGE